MSAIIPIEDVSFPQKRQRDDVGRVFEWQGRVFRGIFPTQENHVRRLFSTGLLEELINLGYIPKTWITDFKIQGFEMILEHERIWPVIYPQEWTFSMLRDAALHVYELARVLKHFRINMKDCHGLNVLFDGISPKFSDIGSFIPDENMGWKPYEEFLRFYYYPLRIWQYNAFVGKLSIFSGNLTTHEAYLNYRYPSFRLLSTRMQRRLIALSIAPCIASQTDNLKGEKISGHRQRLRLHHILKKVLKKIIPIEELDMDQVISRIREMRQTYHTSEWGHYHEDIREKADRFDRIIEIVNGLEEKIESAVDLGGNQAKFSSLLLQRTPVERVVCIDSDENAIDVGYDRQKNAKTSRIAFAHFDFMGCIAKLRFMTPAERFRSDVAFALALTHHLTLAQGYDIADVFRNIAAYARKYVFIEFMPLGLWSTGRQPDVPNWYSRDRFNSMFKF